MSKPDASILSELRNKSKYEHIEFSLPGDKTDELHCELFDVHGVVKFGKIFKNSPLKGHVNVGDYCLSVDDKTPKNKVELLKIVDESVEELRFVIARLKKRVTTNVKTSSSKSRKSTKGKSVKRKDSFKSKKKEKSPDKSEKSKVKVVKQESVDENQKVKVAKKDDLEENQIVVNVVKKEDAEENPAKTVDDPKSPESKTAASKTAQSKTSQMKKPPQQQTSDDECQSRTISEEEPGKITDPVQLASALGFPIKPEWEYIIRDVKMTGSTKPLGLSIMQLAKANVTVVSNLQNNSISSEIFKIGDRFLAINYTPIINVQLCKKFIVDTKGNFTALMERPPNGLASFGVQKPTNALPILRSSYTQPDPSNVEECQGDPLYGYITAPDDVQRIILSRLPELMRAFRVGSTKSSRRIPRHIVKLKIEKDVHQSTIPSDVAKGAVLKKITKRDQS